MRNADLTTLIAKVIHEADDLGQCALLAAALAQRIQSALGGFTHHADTQHTGHLGNGRIDAAVAGQIVQAAQGKDQLCLLGILPHLSSNLFHGHALLHQLHNFLYHQHHLRAGGIGVQNLNLSLGISPLILVLRHHGRIIGAGQIAGNGDAEHLLRIAKGIHPLTSTGAGGAAAAGIAAQIFYHIRHIQIGIIHKLTLTGSDLQRGIGQIYTGHLQQIGGRVNDDFISHKGFSFVVQNIITSVFQKPILFS